MMFLPSILSLWWIESFPFEVLSYRIEYSEMRTHDICLAVWILEVTIGVSYWFTRYMLWHSTRGFPRWYWGNLCIGVDARFSQVETSGSLYSSLCGLSIMNMNMLWCYSRMNSRIDRTEKIALHHFSTNGKNSFELVSYHTNNSYHLFSANRNLGVILYCTLRDNHMIQLC